MKPELILAAGLLALGLSACGGSKTPTADAGHAQEAHGAQQPHDDGEHAQREHGDEAGHEP